MPAYVNAKEGEEGEKKSLLGGLEKFLFSKNWKN